MDAQKLELVPPLRRRRICGVARVPKASRGPREVTAYAAVPHTAGNTVTLIDTRTNHVCVEAIAVGPGPIGIAMTPDGRRIYVSNSGADSVSVIDVASRAVVGTLTVGRNPTGLAIDPNGERLYVALPKLPGVMVIELASHRLTHTVETRLPCTPMGIVITPDGRKAYLSSAFGFGVSVLDLETLMLGRPILDGPSTNSSGPIGPGPIGIGPIGIAFTPDGRTACITNTAAASVTPVDAATNTAGPPIRVGLKPVGAAVTPDGRFLYVANSGENTVSVIDMQNHTVAATIEMTNRVHPHSSPGSVAITPDGRCAYVIEPASHTISVIDVATQRATGKPMPMSGQPLVLGGFIGPNVIVPGDSSTSSLAIARDRDLTRLGFARFVPFSGGILRLKGRWSTARTIALLDRDPASRLGGGTIDTNGYSASVAGEVVGEGLLIKRGTGDLTLLGDCTNILGTLVIGGTLIVDGSHRGLITVAPGATLRGRGKVRDINLTAGTLSPGCNGIGILNAERVTMDSGTEFAVTLSSLTTDGGHGRLHVIWHDSSLSRHLARIADRNVSPPARIHVSHDRSVATHLEKPACTVKRIGSRGGSAAPCSWSSPASCGRQARDRWRWRKMACSTPPSASGG